MSKRWTLVVFSDSQSRSRQLSISTTTIGVLAAALVVLLVVSVLAGSLVRRACDDGLERSPGAQVDSRPHRARDAAP